MKNITKQINKVILTVWLALVLLPSSAQAFSYRDVVPYIQSMAGAVFQQVSDLKDAFSLGGKEMTATVVKGTVRGDEVEAPLSLRTLAVISEEVTKQTKQSSTTTTIINNPVIERIVERVVQGDVTKAYVDSSLQILSNKFTGEILRNSFNNSGAATGVYQQISLSQKIDRLYNTIISNATLNGGTIADATISNPTITGGSISGSTLSGTTLSSSGGISFGTNILAPVANNCATIPYAFTGDIDTGLCSGATDKVSLYAGGTNVLTASSTALQSTVPYQMTSTTTPNLRITYSNGSYQLDTAQLWSNVDTDGALWSGSYAFESILNPSINNLDWKFGTFVHTKIPSFQTRTFMDVSGLQLVTENHGSGQVDSFKGIYNTHQAWGNNPTTYADYNFSWLKTASPTTVVSAQMNYSYLDAPTGGAAGNITNAMNTRLYTQVQTGNSGTIDNLYNAHSWIVNIAAGRKATNMYGYFHHYESIGANDATNTYGFYYDQETNTNTGDRFSFYNAEDSAPIYSAASVGVGTTSPWAKLSVGNLATDSVRPLFAVASSTANSTTTLFTILNSGNVGINTLNPTSILDINGTTTFRGGLLAGTDNLYDIGTSTAGASRPRSIYYGTSLVGPSSLFTNIPGQTGDTIPWFAGTIISTSPNIIAIEDTSTATRFEAQHIKLQLNPSGAVSGRKAALFVNAETLAGNSQNINTSMRGTYVQMMHAGSGTLSEMTGVDVLNSINHGAGNVTDQIGGRFIASLGGATSAVTRAYGVKAQVQHAAGGQGTISQAVGVQSDIVVGPGVATLAIGFLAQTTGAVGSTDTVGYYVGDLQGINQYAFYNGDTDARIYTASSVGVGTSTPWGLLSVNPNGLASSSPSFVVGSSTATHFIVANTGNVGIGTTNPAAALTVSKSGANDIVGHFINSTATNPNGLYIQFSGAAPDNNSQYFIRGTDNADNRFFVYSDGDVVNQDNSYGAISDVRLKENIGASGNYLDLLNEVQIKTYSFISDHKNEADQLGVIAQELELVLPELVNEGGDGYKTVAYSQFTPIIIKAIQEITSITSSFKDNLIAWLGDVGNGIGDFFANRVRTKELCISDGAGETCVTRAQLDNLLANAGSSSNNPQEEEEDTSNPVITILGDNPATITVGTTYSDMGATVSDTDGEGNINNNLGLQYSLNGVTVQSISINTSATSTNTIVYSAVDGNNNWAHATRTVHVIE